MGGSSDRPVPAFILDKTIGKTPIVIGTTDPRLHDKTVGKYLRT